MAAGRWALVAFCLISSAIYRLNGCLDVAADRAHLSRRNRPNAAGLTGWRRPWPGVVLLYGLIQVGYFLQIKRMPLLGLIADHPCAWSWGSRARSDQPALSAAQPPQTQPRA